MLSFVWNIINIEPTRNFEKKKYFLTHMSVCLMIIEENNNNKPDTNRSGSIVLLLFQTQTLTAKC